jgi:hypothetical protein
MRIAKMPYSAAAANYRWPRRAGFAKNAARNDR